ncbi:helix-turn-helix domain-containing protein [Paenibacillus silvae]|uniref:helix-turn-helix domain-containing protein n=1 Tax=Paenibacillus silvae TaxID=1325358 RepID=UPI002002E876|nr:AraC family transcriptional regulator [Paenibacillus silvae]MCK6076666.1 AraC family transcriptional regulator [Paenibacillus silvae]MCK6151093.1 AraC family transcriptional regulator [Paenibacillus silvae]MCK6269352.1 AraC family transcriptional regulator [Paenibacillus silvae]
MDHNEVIERALIHIEGHLQQSLTVESVAHTFNMSKYYFHWLFSAMMGCSLNQYILSRRLNASLAFIQNKNSSLTDIAYQLNFGTQASFTRAFKRQYGVAPSSLKTGLTTISPAPLPTVVKRPFKNINGDIVMDFTLTEFKETRISGIAFEVNLANDDYKEKIRAHSKMLLSHIDETINGPCYVIYSNCQPDSTQFKVLFGIPSSIEIDKPYFFTVDVPQFFCVRFNYCGELLDIGDVLESDYARFLKISKQETAETDIELIQAFDDVHHLNSTYHIYAPIKKLPTDSDL